MCWILESWENMTVGCVCLEVPGGAGVHIIPMPVPHVRLHMPQEKCGEATGAGSISVRGKDVMRDAMWTQRGLGTIKCL